MVINIVDKNGKNGMDIKYNTIKITAKAYGAWEL